MPRAKKTSSGSSGSVLWAAFAQNLIVRMADQDLRQRGADLVWRQSVIGRAADISCEFFHLTERGDHTEIEYRSARVLSPKPCTSARDVLVSGAAWPRVEAAGIGFFRAGGRPIHRFDVIIAAFVKRCTGLPRGLGYGSAP